MKKKLKAVTRSSLKQVRTSTQVHILQSNKPVVPLIRYDVNASHDSKAK